jgi:hypothetical protein
MPLTRRIDLKSHHSNPQLICELAETTLKSVSALSRLLCSNSVTACPYMVSSDLLATRLLTKCRCQGGDV